MFKILSKKPFCSNILRDYANKKDHLISGFIKEGWARFVFSDASDSVAEVCKKFNITKNKSRDELGIAFNTGLIMNSFLHGEERVKILAQYEKDCVLTSVYSESISNGEIRGLLEETKLEESSNEPNFLKVSKILYNHQQEVSGFVKLKDHQLTAEDIYNYFEQSEQITTHVYFNNSNLLSQGFILQKMPGCDLNKLQVLFNSLTNHKGFQDIFSNRLTASEVYKLFQDLNVEVELRRTPVQLFCRCSLAQFLNVMRGMASEEILDMKEKQQRTLTCQMCRKQYIMQDSDFEYLLNSKKLEQGKTNSK